jgi:PilZ domain-containing protein
MRTQDQRQAKRKRVLKGARILIPSLGISVDCALRDLSQTGACLVLTTQVAITNEFELATYDGAIKQCRVVWRTASRVGVSFD